ncbi:MAG: hypothetical protein NVV63_00060 [Opitutus sp.]|nr:hypothetical protein [Opitutus sp.]
MRIAVSGALLIMAGNVASAQEPSAKGRTFHEYSKCMKEAATRYSVLDQPITDIAEAAAASCNDAFAAFSQAVADNVNAPRRPAIIQHAIETARREAVVVIAESKLAAD